MQWRKLIQIPTNIQKMINNHLSDYKMEKLNPKNIENILALTPLQEGMLFHYLQDPQSPLYFEQLSLEISGEIDVPYFEKAWNTVIETNEMLRTVFRWEKLEKPSQIILKEHKCNVIFYDLSAKDGSQKKTALDRNQKERPARRLRFTPGSFSGHFMQAG